MITLFIPYLIIHLVLNSSYCEIFQKFIATSATEDGSTKGEDGNESVKGFGSNAILDISKTKEIVPTKESLDEKEKVKSRDAPKNDTTDIRDLKNSENRIETCKMDEEELMELENATDTCKPVEKELNTSGNVTETDRADGTTETKSQNVIEMNKSDGNELKKSENITKIDKSNEKKSENVSETDEADERKSENVAEMDTSDERESENVTEMDTSGEKKSKNVIETVKADEKKSENVAEMDTSDDNELKKSENVVETNKPDENKSEDAPENDKNEDEKTEEEGGEEDQIGKIRIRDISSLLDTTEEEDDEIEVISDLEKPLKVTKFIPPPMGTKKARNMATPVIFPIGEFDHEYETPQPVPPLKISEKEASPAEIKKTLSDLQCETLAEQRDTVRLTDVLLILTAHDCKFYLRNTFSYTYTLFFSLSCSIRINIDSLNPILYFDHYKKWLCSSSLCHFLIS